MTLDLRIEHANVLTMDPARPSARTIGVWHGLVAGLDEDVDGLPARRTVDLGGATVLPGFVDAHVHLCWEGFAACSLDLSGCVGIDEVLERIRVAARSEPPGGWVDVAGYDQRPLGRHLTCRDLARVAPGRRVFVQHRSGHACVVSAEVLAMLDRAILRSTEGVDLDAAGEPTGLLVEGATLLARQARLPRSIDEMVDAIERSARRCLAEGVTTCCEAGIGAGLLSHSPVELAAYQAALDQGRLPLRVQVMVGAAAVHPLAAHADDPVTRGLDLGLRTGLGDDRLSIGALKLYLDGGMMARTAALTTPYEGGDQCGMLSEDPAEVLELATAAHAAGWQLALHAIGDRAVDVALDAIEEAQWRRPRPDARHRIEHSGLLRPDQLPRYAGTSAIAVVQPSFLWAYGDDYAAVLGPERTEWMYRGRGFAGHGVPLAGSSDRPVATGAPLRAIQFMVERTTAGGQVLGPAEGLTVMEALTAYTRTAAFACRREAFVGALAPGMRADMVVLAEDPRSVPSSQLAGIGVMATLVDGRVAHGDLSG